MNRPRPVAWRARTRSVRLCLGLGLASVACGGEPSQPTTQRTQTIEAPATVTPPSPLEALVAEVQRARAAGEADKAKAIIADLVPTKADLVAILAPGKGADAFLAAWKFVDLPANQPAVVELGSMLFSPSKTARTETRVFAATTEEIVAYTKDSVAWKEFPGGMRRFAAIAAPGRTWWVVEHVEPGKDVGMKYTCFTQVAGRWIFLPKPWSALPRETE